MISHALALSVFHGCCNTIPDRVSSMVGLRYVVRFTEPHNYIRKWWVRANSTMRGLGGLRTPRTRPFFLELKISESSDSTCSTSICNLRTCTVKYKKGRKILLSMTSPGTVYNFPC